MPFWIAASTSAGVAAVATRAEIDRIATASKLQAPSLISNLAVVSQGQVYRSGWFPDSRKWPSSGSCGGRGRAGRRACADQVTQQPELDVVQLPQLLVRHNVAGHAEVGVVESRAEADRGHRALAEHARGRH